jgi:hypothetical protein
MASSTSSRAAPETLRRGSHRESVAASASRNRAYSTRGTNSPPLRKPTTRGSSRASAAAAAAASSTPASETRRTERSVTTTTTRVSTRRSPVKEDFRPPSLPQRGSGSFNRPATASVPTPPRKTLELYTSTPSFLLIRPSSATMEAGSFSYRSHIGAVGIANISSPAVLDNATIQGPQTP